jgi:hypothetical protein
MSQQPAIAIALPVVPVELSLRGREIRRYLRRWSG